MLEMSFTCVTTSPIEAIAITASWGITLNGLDLTTDVFGRLCGFLCQFFYLVCDNSEAFASLSGAGRGDGRTASASS